jgi:hypothetical protein
MQAVTNQRKAPGVQRGHDTTTREKMSESHETRQGTGNGNPAFQFVDNRPEALLQRKLHTLARNSTASQPAPLQVVQKIQGGSGSANVIQRVRFAVNPMPTMAKQVGEDVPSQGLHNVDLNCGWYSLMSALDHFKQNGRNLKGGVVDPVYDQKKYGYQPENDSSNSGEPWTTEIDQPQSINDWHAMLIAHGPLIISGQVGRMNVKILKNFFKLIGWGHYILIVGVDTDEETLLYKDPLVGDVTKEVALAKMKDFIDAQTVSYINEANLQ